MVARVEDYLSDLFPMEEAYAATFGESRALEFASGRAAARVALGRIGVAPCEIGRSGRLPIWPESVVGSIAHTSTLAAAIAGPATHHHGLGIDIEGRTAVSPEVAERVLTPAERAWMPAPEWRTMIYSGKEAVYKAAFPLTGEFLGFQDVELEIDFEAGVFRARYRRTLRSGAVMAAGHGHWAVYRGHWLVVFVIPRDAST